MRSVYGFDSPRLCKLWVNPQLLRVCASRRRQDHRAHQCLIVIPQRRLTPRMEHSAAEALAAKLAGGHWTHDYALTAQEARELGLPVTVGMFRSVPCVDGSGLCRSSIRR